MVNRLYVEKKVGFDHEAVSLLHDIRSFLQINALQKVRLLNRYDVEGIDEVLFEACKHTVFSEPQLDNIYYDLSQDESIMFATEFLPGQFDQRADSAAQCIQLASQGERPLVRTAKVFMLYGSLTCDEIAAIKKYVINPVESREASLAAVDSLVLPCDIPTEVKILKGFICLSSTQLNEFISEYGLAMDLDDIKYCQAYFMTEQRDPTLTEIRMIDTYWSDHCRHTTFLTSIDTVEFDDSTVQAAYERYLNIRKFLNIKKPITLMDLAIIGGKYLKRIGLLTDLDESEEINACTVKIDVEIEGEIQKWLLLFKNETHNHPTEIEPFGGAATCIGGAIRDPLSGRSYVYQAMRVTGAANPLKSISETMKGKLPQRKIVTTAAAGNSSYGNQIGLATGLVDEIYHEGYAAKHLEIGAVLGAAPASNVRREDPVEGDIVVLLGGRTGRDGCGGATGSSKSHNLSSIEKCGAEVQKGNAPEERKLQRLFRNPEVTKLIKRCNDFGAGGVSVAIGELADGLRINLSAVPKKYEGLDGTELAISESQERMAVVLDKSDVKNFISLACGENLEATVVAEVTREARLVMEWNGVEIVNISRDFLNSNGAQKHATAHVTSAQLADKCQDRCIEGTIQEKLFSLVGDLNICSKRGLSERFDSTVGSNTVLMPFGGKRQLTPIQAMVAKIPVLYKETKTCTAMAYGYNPFIAEKSPYHGAYLAVVESVAKLVATGADVSNCHLTFQEYFERLGTESTRWGKPLAALLGALDAQLDLGIAAIGGKDSMSGSFENIDVPPTLVSFAVSVSNTDDIISPEFKRANSKVVLLTPEIDDRGLPCAQSLKENFAIITKLIKEKKVLSAYTVTYGGIAEGIFKMCLGNWVGFAFSSTFDMERAFGYQCGAFILELAGDDQIGKLLGRTTDNYQIIAGNDTIDLPVIERIYENKLESVYPCNIVSEDIAPKTFSFAATNRTSPRIGIAKPLVLIPVFPGTNCEYDSANALMKAGAQPEIMVINNLSATGVIESVEHFAKLIDASQMILIPGGFSGGDEPDGSGKFITAFFRNPLIREKVNNLLNVRDGLMCGICNGFQALIKLGLVPFGEIRDMDDQCPTLTFNTIGRHQSRLVRTRISSNKSPWLMYNSVGDIHLTATSHGEGRFIVSDELLQKLVENGQIATQYVDQSGIPSMDISINPNGSMHAIEGITSPDGRIFGKMAHSERYGDNLYKNVLGNQNNDMFRGAVDYFKI